MDGASFARAVLDKERTYPELASPKVVCGKCGLDYYLKDPSRVTTSPRDHTELASPNPYDDLTVLACETGGRWHETARGMVSRLVHTRTQTVHPILRRAAALAYTRRWWSLLSVALQHTVAMSLLDKPGMGGAPGAGPAPFLGDVLHMAQEYPAFSRLPLRG